MGSASPGAATPARFTFPPARDPVLQHCVLATAKGSVEAEQLGWDAQQGWRKGGGIVQNGMASPYTPQGQRISDSSRRTCSQIWTAFQTGAGACISCETTCSTLRQTDGCATTCRQ
jgi:hypothetical protein